MTKKSIWVLTSVACDYCQPPNNLEAWWSEKPTAQQLAKVIYGIYDEPPTWAMSTLLETGHYTREYHADFSLFQWDEEE